MITKDREVFFWERVRKTPSCWLWIGSKNRRGYGSISLTGRRFTGGEMEGAHRYSWQLHFGSIPTGRSVLHHCDNPPCVRPEHLYLGTQIENGRDVRERKRHPNAQKTHCIRGHEFTAQNTIVNRDGRHCRACQNAANRASYKRRKVA